MKKSDIGHEGAQKLCRAITLACIDDCILNAKRYYDAKAIAEKTGNIEATYQIKSYLNEITYNKESLREIDVDFLAAIGFNNSRVVKKRIEQIISMKTPELAGLKRLSTVKQEMTA